MDLDKKSWPKAQDSDFLRAKSQDIMKSIVTKWVWNLKLGPNGSLVFCNYLTLIRRSVEQQAVHGIYVVETIDNKDIDY